VSLPYSWIYCMHFLSFFLTWGGGLNLGPCTSQASTLPLEQWAQLYTQFWPNAVKINNEEISQIKFLIPLHTFDAGKLCQSRYHQLWLNPWMICYFPVPDFFLNLLPKKQMVPKSKVKVNWSKNFRFVERWHGFSRSWVALGEKWIKHPQYNSELCASWAFVVFPQRRSPWNQYTSG
jgi:hypothetical protein